jgi:hypothetical protein
MRLRRFHKSGNGFHDVVEVEMKMTVRNHSRRGRGTETRRGDAQDPMRPQLDRHGGQIVSATDP